MGSSGAQGKDRSVDVAIIGAGPAGASAAVALATRGCDVLLIDEAPSAGGRIWRAPAAALRGGTESPEIADGDLLRQRVSQSSVPMLTESAVWSVGRVETRTELGLASANGEPIVEERPRFRIDVLSPDGPCTVFARSLLIAAGTTERIIPFPGWTTPGVVGLAATTVLLKSQRMAPGKHVVVAGSGPLLMSVAAGVLKAGARVSALADIAGFGDWVAALPALAREPRLAMRGSGWWLKCLRAGVRPRFRTGVIAAEGTDRLEAVVLGAVDRNGAPVPGAGTHRVECDALAIGHGLAPATEMTRVLRAKHVFDRGLGGWHPETDEEGRTSVTGLYVAGDGAGVRGASFAVQAGTRTGVAIARDLRIDTRQSSIVNTSAAPVGRAMSFMTRQRPAMCAAIPPQTVVCRCEEVTRAEIETAIDDGAEEINQLKHFTRCGMGPCQGRICGEIAAELLALRMARGSSDVDAARMRVGQWTGRTPLRPIPLDAMVGDFSYDDIPVPEPAPL